MEIGREGGAAFCLQPRHGLRFVSSFPWGLACEQPPWRTTRAMDRSTNHGFLETSCMPATLPSFLFVPMLTQTVEWLTWHPCLHVRFCMQVPHDFEGKCMHVSTAAPSPKARAVDPQWHSTGTSQSCCACLLVPSFHCIVCVVPLPCTCVRAHACVLRRCVCVHLCLCTDARACAKGQLRQVRTCQATQANTVDFACKCHAISQARACLLVRSVFHGGVACRQVARLRQVRSGEHCVPCRAASCAAPRAVLHPAMACSCQVLDFQDVPSAAPMAEPVASLTRKPKQGRKRKRKASGCTAQATRLPKPMQHPVKTGEDLTSALWSLVFATGVLIPVFLELFSGSKHLTFGMIHARVPSIGVDILDGFDLCEPALQAAVTRAIAAGWIISVWMGLPCNSWSKARRGRTWAERTLLQEQGKRRRRSGYPAALRDMQHLWGLPCDSLSPSDQRTLQRHNTLVAFALEVIDQCVDGKVPVAMENPGGSMVWSLPDLQRRIHNAIEHVNTVTTDYCCWGTPWRKRTTMIFWFWPPAVAGLARVCRASRGAQGKPAICSTSRKPHVHLSGLDPMTKTFRTKQADPYPPKLVEALVAASGLAKVQLPVDGH